MEISLLELKNLLANTSSPTSSFHSYPLIGKYVIVRSAPSGVHVGYVESYNESTNTIMLKDSRRIHYWEKAFTLTAIAIDGLDIKSEVTRLSASIDLIFLGYICEIIPCSTLAERNLLSYPTHKI